MAVREVWRVVPSKPLFWGNGGGRVSEKAGLESSIRGEKATAVSQRQGRLAWFIIPPTERNEGKETKGLLARFSQQRCSGSLERGFSLKA